MFENVLFPLFSSPVVIYKFYRDVDILDQVKEDYTFSEITKECATGSYISNRTDVLNDFPTLQSDIFKYFNHFKNSVMRYEHVDFEMTTSWFTRSTENSFSHFHVHKNCMFSGVLYLTTDESIAPIEFQHSGVSSNLMIMPTEKNLYNSETWNLFPEKNMIVFFPSNVRHRIGYHSSKQDRYSIAFNFFPTGKIGFHDSAIDLHIN